MRKRAHAPAVVLLTAAALVVAACSSSGTAPPSTSAPSPTTAPAPDAGTNPTPPPPSTSVPTSTEPGGPVAVTRDPLRWPYPWNSIWNYPLGDAARLVPLNMVIPTERTLNVEEDIIVADPDAPLVPIVRHDAAWNDGETRCGEQLDGDLITPGVPIPPGFVTDPGYWGVKPNHATAIVMADLTLFETQPLHICPDGTVVSEYTNERWQGDSILTGGMGGEPDGGAHGGSFMTAFGGTIRLGEWVPGGAIRHAIKVDLDSGANLSTVGGGFRWPALVADSGYLAGYAGSVSEARMGSLLALAPDFDVAALATEPARILATTLARYGAYVVDGSGWSTAMFATEWGPDGRVIDEFEREWGYPLAGHRPLVTGSQAEFLGDIETIYANLQIVDDNAPGNVGGSGDRLAPWAPSFSDGTGSHP